MTPAHAHPPYCGIRWGSLPEQRKPGSTGVVTDVRAGRHACFDRLVLDVSGDVNGYLVRYVEHVRRDGSGALVPVRGGARLQVVVTAPPTPTDSWFLPNGELLDPRGYRTFRHLAWQATSRVSRLSVSVYGRGCRSGCSRWTGQAPVHAWSSTSPTAGDSSPHHTDLHERPRHHTGRASRS
jgi:hypothetical protein